MPTPFTTKLRRYSLTVTKDKSATDPAQVLADASLSVYKQGATAQFPVSIPSGQTGIIRVYDVGRIRSGDTVQRGTGDGSTGVVGVIVRRDQIPIIGVADGTLEFAPGDRVVPVTNRPALFTESTGTQSPGSSVNFTGGYLPPTYTKERFFDAVVTELATPPSFTRLLSDQPSGHALRVLDVRDFGGVAPGPNPEANIQAVLDLIAEAFPLGGVVYLAKGDWPIAAPLKVRKGRVIIQGECKDTRLIASGAVNILELEGDNSQGNGIHDFTLRDITLVGSGLAGTDTGHGIYCNCQGGYRPAGFRFINVHVTNTGNDAILFTRPTLATAGGVDFPLFIDCGFVLSNKSGMRLLHTRQATFIHCHAAANLEYGLYAEDCDVYWQGIGIEGNGLNLTDATLGGQIRLKDCVSCMICRTDIEAFGGAATPIARNGIVIESCRGVVISGCSFYPGAVSGEELSTTGVRIIGGSVSVLSNGVQVVGNTFGGIGTAVKVHSDCVDVLLAQNNIGGLPTGGKAYDYPTGTAAEGMRLVVSGAMESSIDKTFGQHGITLPVAGGSAPLPVASAANEGTLVCDPTAKAGHDLKLAVHLWNPPQPAPPVYSWYPVGGAPAFTIGVGGTLPPASEFAPGTLVWITNETATKRLYVSTGAAWRYVLLQAP